MPKMKYNKQFRNGICALVIVLVIGIFLIASGIVSQVQFHELAEDMLTTEAHVTEVSTRRLGRWWTEWTIQVSHTVDSVTYSGELKVETETFITYYMEDINVGDTARIMYNPNDPTEIATELSIKSSRSSLILPTLFVLIGFIALVVMIRRRKKYTITEAEYRREKEERKKRKKRKT